MENTPYLYETLLRVLGQHSEHHNLCTAYHGNARCPGADNLCESSGGVIFFLYRRTYGGLDHGVGHLRPLSLTRQRACWHQYL